MILQDKNTIAVGGYLDKLKKAASLSTVELIDNSYVRKTFHHRNNFTDEWLQSYNDLRSWDQRYVKVYNVGSNYIEMEYIKDAVYYMEILDGVTNHTIDERLKIISEYLDIFSTSYSYVANNTKEIFLHNDIQNYNVLVTKENELVIIDPDACSYYPNFEKLLPNYVGQTTKSMNKYSELLHKKVNQNAI